MNRSREELENYAATRRYLAENLVKERKPDDEIREEHWDVAAALQECLDKTAGGRKTVRAGDGPEYEF